MTGISTADRAVTMSEVVGHSGESSCWIVIDSVVYDVTKFLKSHPGGKGAILAYGGKDATEAFFDFHKKDIIRKFGPKLKVGVLEGQTPSVDLNFDACAEIDTVTPFAEATHWRGWHSPYYNDSHHQLKMALRKFIAKEILPTVEAEEEAGVDPSSELVEKTGKAGMLACRVGVTAAPFMKALGIKFGGVVDADQVDNFHELIGHSEFARVGYPGSGDGLAAGLTIGLPPIIHFGSKELKARVAVPCLLGQKRICLAISEPAAGSDVAGLMTTARLSPDGKSYIVNGMKKWITAGFPSDYFVTAVRTGGKGHGGVSLLLVERSEGVTTSKIKTSYSPAAGTALVLMENVVVPRSNLLGKENDGFRLIMANFNHERWIIVCGYLQLMRLCVAECYRWAIQRKAFGKRLIDQPVIRYKLAEMSAAVDALDAWLESITYQMNKMNYQEQTAKLSAPIALMKFHTTRLGRDVSDNACQIFGGRAITRTGMGQHVERFQRAFKFGAIYGGSEEILADLAVRQSVAAVEHAAKASKKAHAMSRL